MRFYEDLRAYYFSTDPVTDPDERSLIFDQCKAYVKEYAKGFFRFEDTASGNVKKFLPVVLFGIALVLLIFFSVNKMIPALLFTFGGLFVLFGIAFFLPWKEDKQIELPQTSKIPRAVPGIAAISFGLGVIVPAAAAPVFGYSKAMVAGGATWFVTGGLVFIVYFVISLMRFSRASRNKVYGKCIGYIKMIDSNSNSNTRYSAYRIIGAPVFEYRIDGITYRAFQEDNMRTGRLTPDVGETVELGVLPDDPYAVFYHRNTGARIFVLVMSLLVLAAGVFLFSMLPKVNDDNGFVVSSMGGITRLAKAKFDDKTIEKYISSDYTIEYVKVTAAYDLEGIPVAELSNGTGIKLKEDEREKYPVGTEIYIVKPIDGSPGLNFRAEEWEYSGSREVKGKAS